MVDYLKKAFSFSPQLVYISAGQPFEYFSFHYDYGYKGYRSIESSVLLTRETTLIEMRMMSLYYESNKHPVIAYLKPSFEGNALTWFSYQEEGHPVTQIWGSDQLNEDGKVYSWVALG